jgi:hypothetical protein
VGAAAVVGHIVHQLYTARRECHHVHMPKEAVLMVDMSCEKVPGTGEVARFPAETLGTHKDGNTEHNVTSTGSPTATPGNESLTKQPHSTIEGVQTKAASP